MMIYPAVSLGQSVLTVPLDGSAVSVIIGPEGEAEFGGNGLSTSLTSVIIPI